MDSYRLLGLVASAVVLAQPAAASHTTLAQEEFDESFWAPMEDDHERFRQPGHALDGIENRVTSAASAVGGGGPFLDSRFMWGPLVYVSGSTLGEAALDRGDVILPGAGSFYTYHGQWNDLDLDGRIDDRPDAAQEGGDEFIWTGMSRGDAVHMPFFVVPTNGRLGEGPVLNRDPEPAAFANATDSRPDGWFADRTNDTQPGWFLGNGFSNLWLDESWLVTTQTVTVASTVAAVGNVVGVDLRADGVLVDVDRYGTLSPEVESLWMAAARVALATRDAASTEVLDTFNKTTTTLYAAVGQASPLASVVGGLLPEHPPAVEDLVVLAGDAYTWADTTVTAMYDDALGTALGAQKMWVPPQPKEPNHPMDDYEGRAQGAFRDVRGAGNSYVGYQDGAAFWMDVWAEFHVPMVANVQVPATSISLGFTGAYATGIEPTASGPGEQERNAGVQMAFRAIAGVWHDRNHDGWIGAWCDPDEPAEWDPLDGTCREDPYAAYLGETYGQPNAYRSGTTPIHGHGNEFVGCEWSGGDILVMPADGGRWPPGTMLFRDHSRALSGILWQDFELLEGRAPATIRMDRGTTCADETPASRSLDVIWFARGNPEVPILTMTDAATSGWLDEERGITVGPQRVVDVDHYPASL